LREQCINQQLSGIYNAVIALPEALLPVVLQLPVTGCQSPVCWREKSNKNLKKELRSQLKPNT
jgi:hypothetical protein